MKKGGACHDVVARTLGDRAATTGHLYGCLLGPRVGLWPLVRRLDEFDELGRRLAAMSSFGLGRTRSLTARAEEEETPKLTSPAPVANLARGILFSGLCCAHSVLLDRILKSGKPGDLPAQYPVKCELMVNLKSAKALGLDISSVFLSIAGRPHGRKIRPWYAVSHHRLIGAKLAGTIRLLRCSVR